MAINKRRSPPRRDPIGGDRTSPGYQVMRIDTGMTVGRASPGMTEHRGDAR